MNRKALIFNFNKCAGILEEHDEGKFTFIYNKNYLKDTHSKPISLTMPLTAETYESTTLFPFFDGLIPEGWLLNITVKNWKLDPKDRMGILINACRDCIGSVHVEPIEDDTP